MGEASTDSTVNDLVRGKSDEEREKGGRDETERNGAQARELVCTYVCQRERERERVLSEETCEACALCRFLSQSQTASCGAGTVTTVLAFSVTLSVVLH